MTMHTAMRTGDRVGNGRDEATDFTPRPSDTGKANTAGKNGRASADKTLIILDGRALDRECFGRSLLSSGIGMKVLAFASIGDWLREAENHPPLAVVVLSIGGRKLSDPGIGSELKAVTAGYPGVPVVVLADTDDLDQVLLALEQGARGYIPTSVGIKICAEAIGLAMAGGIFVPASSVVRMQAMIGNGREAARPMAHMFTLRQEEVACALRQGKANKIIAYELNLRESTVKVHIRNIMKKLKATNRTEVAYKLGELFPSAASNDYGIGLRTGPSTSSG